ncbi:facilitated trehalose transporter Tret1-like [Scylla paramamosain]|uniref:facilitated trehalose transporter Tret1-like n=1 Tax=Scylla paramamosain TaxID=85552 RepID=UPI003083EAD8
MESQITPPHQIVAEEKEPRVERHLRLAKQVAMLQIITLGNVAAGSAISWPSPALSALEKDNSTLVGTVLVLTTAEKDLVGSLTFMGAILGTLNAGWMLSKFGRRQSLQLMGLPCIAGWMVLGLAPNTILFFTGRLLQGIVLGSMNNIGYVYIVESSDTNIRGMMALLSSLGISLGNLYTVAVGYALPWYYLCFVCAINAVMFTVVTFILPESPSYLVIQGRRQDALSVLRSLRGKYADIEAEVRELEYMNSSSRSGWKGLLNKDTLHRITAVATCFLLSQMSGNYVMLVFTARILENTGAFMDPNAITAIAGVPRVAGTIAACFLMDRVGRRYSLLVSHAINAVCMIILGSYVYLAEAATQNDDIFSKFSWVPMVCVMISFLAWTLGVQTVPPIISSEYFPTNIRGQASSICLTMGNVIIFAMLQLYSPMLALLSQPGLFLFYGCSSILGVFFALFMVETRGKAIG